MIARLRFLARITPISTFSCLLLINAFTSIFSADLPQGDIVTPTPVLINTPIPHPTVESMKIPDTKENKPQSSPIALTIGNRQKESPLLVVVIMVKNEEPVIAATLKPYIEGGIKHYFVYDTGSTDNTVEVAKKYLEENHITEGYIIQEPFVDFATSRNKALDLAKKLFPTSSFLLMPDAEWYLENTQDLLEFCRQERENITIPGYYIRIGHEWTNFWTPRLFRTHAPIRFIGRIHEYAVHIPCVIKAPENVRFYWGSSRGQEKSKKRWVQDKELLLQEYETNPQNLRTLFYLAQTCDCLNHLEEAHHFYKLRLDLREQGHAEENFLTAYRLADVAERLVKSGNTSYTWALAQEYYLQAAALRPGRAEPLVKLALHYWLAKNYDLCFMFARRAVDIVFPQRDTLSVDIKLYDYVRFDLLALCGYYSGNCEIGKEALMHLLKSHKDDRRLIDNLNMWDCVDAFPRYVGWRTPKKTMLCHQPLTLEKTTLEDTP